MSTATQTEGEGESVTPEAGTQWYVDRDELMMSGALTGCPEMASSGRTSTRQSGGSRGSGEATTEHVSPESVRSISVGNY
jgi:hypothetical protein